MVTFNNIILHMTKKHLGWSTYIQLSNLMLALKVVKTLAIP